jgi:hypothetical protein
MERIIVGERYLDELKAFPDDVLSASAANIAKNLGTWNYMNVMLQTRLQTHILRGPITQNLGALTLTSDETRG